MSDIARLHSAEAGHKVSDSRLSPSPMLPAKEGGADLKLPRPTDQRVRSNSLNPVRKPVISSKAMSQQTQLSAIEGKIDFKIC